MVCMPNFCPGLHGGVDLVDLLLADQVPDRGGRDHDLEGHRPPPTVGGRDQLLREHALEHEGQLGPHLGLLGVGNTSMIRLMVWAQELVCRVPSVRWPVSAMVSAA